jgi:DNA uptake protein ComE-like DNA-binding protein
MRISSLSSLSLPLSLALALSFAGCAIGASGPSDRVAALTGEQRDGIVAAVNCACTSVESLLDGGVHTRAARNLIARRDGPDGVFGTADDLPFETFEEIDAVPQVGPAAIRALLEYAIDAGFVSADDLIGVWEGVPFSAREAELTLHLANTASRSTLTGKAGVRSNAADNLIAARTIADMDALSAVPQVGPATMAALKAYALAVADDRPDLNTATSAELQACAYVGPATAAAILGYRENLGHFETYEELRALPAFGYSVPISANTIAGVRDCVGLAGERPRFEGVTVEDLLADPGAFDGGVVVLEDVVMTDWLSATAPRTMRLFDFAAWGYADWDAAGVPDAAGVELVVDPGPEMYRRTSTGYQAQQAIDTRLNRVNLTGIFEIEGTAARVRVREPGAPGRDFLQVDQRWVSAANVASLQALWTRENGVIRTTGGASINRIAADLLNVHPAVRWHTQQTGEIIDVGKHPECYDCSVSPYTDGPGGGLYRDLLDAWVAAGRP